MVDTGQQVISEEANKKLALNTAIVRLRKERKRILLCKLKPEDGTVDKLGFLAPPSAIYLSMLDGTRTVEDVSEVFQYIFGIPEKKNAMSSVKHIHAHLVHAFGNDIVLGVNGSGTPLRNPYNPLDFVINREEIDLPSTRLDAPVEINYIVTQRCKRNCIYCFAEREQAPEFSLIPFTRLTEILEEASKLGIYVMLLSGGEPFLRTDLPEIIGAIIRHRITPFVSTKAFLSPKVCSRLEQAGLKLIQVSLDSASPAVAEFLTGAKGYLDQMERTLENLRRTQIRVKGKVVATPYNILGVRDVLDLYARKGVTWVHVVIYSRSAFRHQNSLFVENDAIRAAANQIRDFKATNPHVKIECNFLNDNDDIQVSGSDDNGIDLARKREVFESRSLCSVGKTGLTILPDGKVFACEQLPTRDEFILGDLNSQSITEVWNSKKLAELVMPAKEKFVGQPCYDCDDFETCHLHKGRCIRDAHILFGNAFAVDPKCPKAPETPRQQ